MPAYYNEIDPKAAQWLRNLIAAGLIADGEVDNRSIVDVHADDVRGFDQVHLFAGIGVWSYALRLAGWPDDRRVLTVSCPCQPFSSAGKRRGKDDERHLWPEAHRLIDAYRPPAIFGEQVASPAGREWFAGAAKPIDESAQAKTGGQGLYAVRPDLEAMGYAVGCADLCAAGVGAPHIRQRLYFVAYDHQLRREAVSKNPKRQHDTQPRGDAGGVDDTAGHRQQRGTEARQAEVGQPRSEQAGQLPVRSQRRGGAGRMADTDCVGLQGRLPRRQGSQRQALNRPSGYSLPIGDPDPLGDFWRGADWLYCRDQRYRPVEPGTFPLVDGAASRVVRLRAYGNAIVAPLAAEFIRASMRCIP